MGDRGASANNLARLELEQNKFNYQRQLITEARNRLNNSGGCFGPVSGGLAGGYATAGTGGTELQPLQCAPCGSGTASAPQHAQVALPPQWSPAANAHSP